MFGEVKFGEADLISWARLSYATKTWFMPNDFTNFGEVIKRRIIIV